MISQIRALLILLLFLAANARAQLSGRLVGSVSDPSGAVPGWNLVDQDTGAKFIATSGSDGKFVFVALDTFQDAAYGFSGDLGRRNETGFRQ